MTISLSRVDGPWPVHPVPDPPRKEADATEATGFASDLASASAAAVPSPPPEVSAEVREAAAAAASLLAEGRELRFDQDDDGRLRVRLQDTQGNLLRPVATSEVLDFAAGKVTR